MSANEACTRVSEAGSRHCRGRPGRSVAAKLRTILNASSGGVGAKTAACPGLRICLATSRERMDHRPDVLPSYNLRVAYHSVEALPCTESNAHAATNNGIGRYRSARSRARLRCSGMSKSQGTPFLSLVVRPIANPGAHPVLGNTLAAAVTQGSE